MQLSEAQSALEGGERGTDTAHSTLLILVAGDSVPFQSPTCYLFVVDDPLLARPPPPGMG